MQDVLYAQPPAAFSPVSPKALPTVVNIAIDSLDSVIVHVPDICCRCLSTEVSEYDSVTATFGGRYITVSICFAYCLACFTACRQHSEEPVVRAEIFSATSGTNLALSFANQNYAERFRQENAAREGSSDNTAVLFGPFGASGDVQTYQVMPARAEECIARAEDRIKKGDYDGALREYREGLNGDAKNWRLFYEAGRVEHMKAVTLVDVRYSIPYYDKTITLNSAFAPAFRNRARARLATGDYWRPQRDLELMKRITFISDRTITEALGDMNTAVSIESWNPQLYLDRGITRLIQSDSLLSSNTEAVHRALADFSEAIKLDGGFSQAYIFRGLILEQAFLRRDLARRDFEAAVQGDRRGGELMKELRKRLALLKIPGSIRWLYLLRPILRWWVFVWIANALLIGSLWFGKTDPGHPISSLAGLFLLSELVGLFTFSITNSRILRGIGIGELFVFTVPYAIWSILVGMPALKASSPLVHNVRLWMAQLFLTLGAVLLWLLVSWWPKALLERDYLRRLFQQTCIGECLRLRSNCGFSIDW